VVMRVDQGMAGVMPAHGLTLPLSYLYRFH